MLKLKLSNNWKRKILDMKIYDPLLTLGPSYENDALEDPPLLLLKGLAP